MADERRLSAQNTREIAQRLTDMNAALLDNEFPDTGLVTAISLLDDPQAFADLSFRLEVFKHHDGIGNVTEVQYESLLTDDSMAGHDQQRQHPRSAQVLQDLMELPSAFNFVIGRGA